MFPYVFDKPISLYCFLCSVMRSTSECFVWTTFSLAVECYIVVSINHPKKKRVNLPEWNRSKEFHSSLSSSSPLIVPLQRNCRIGRKPEFPLKKSSVGGGHFVFPKKDFVVLCSCINNQSVGWFLIWYFWILVSWAHQFELTNKVFTFTSEKKIKIKVLFCDNRNCCVLYNDLDIYIYIYISICIPLGI